MYYLSAVSRLFLSKGLYPKIKYSSLPMVPNFSTFYVSSLIMCYSQHLHLFFFVLFLFIYIFFSVIHISSGQVFHNLFWQIL
jgi:hypothetical protein